MRLPMEGWGGLMRSIFMMTIVMFDGRTERFPVFSLNRPYTLYHKVYDKSRVNLFQNFLSYQRIGQNIAIVGQQMTDSVLATRSQLSIADFILQSRLDYAGNVQRRINIEVGARFKIRSRRGNEAESLQFSS